jgi:SAM-dependent methyltransferase
MRKLVLWGHNADEYREMFDLSPDEMNSRILEYGCGPSAVNAQQASHKHQVISCDPLFVLDKDTLSSKAVMIFSGMAEEVKNERERFDFSRSGSLEHLIAERQEGMKQFFADYEQGKKEERYLGITDYHLPFADFTFDFALSSHYLFADLDDQTVEFHLTVIRELARVAKEVRIFPLIDREGNTSEFLGPVLLGLQQDNYGVEVREVDFHLHKTGNAMLRVWAQQCVV